MAYKNVDNFLELYSREPVEASRYDFKNEYVKTDASDEIVEPSEYKKSSEKFAQYIKNKALSEIPFNCNGYGDGKSNEQSCSLIREIYNTIWGRDSNASGLGAKSSFGNIMLAPCTMNSVVSMIKQKTNKRKLTDDDLFELDFEWYYSMIHCLGNFTLAPVRFDEERSKRFLSYWDLSLNELKNNGFDDLKKDDFAKFINFFFLWDYVDDSAQPVSILLNHKRFVQKNTNDICDNHQQIINGKKADVNAQMCETDSFFENAGYAINRRGLFMCLMLKFQKEFGSEKYSELVQAVFLKSDSVYSDYKEVINAIRNAGFDIDKILTSYEKQAFGLSKIIAIGDVHGCYDELNLLVNYLKDNAIFTSNDTLVFLGDYIDRGDKIKQTLRLIHSLSLKRNVVVLAGNHEDFLIKYVENGYDRRVLAQWEANGGDKTINEYIDVDYLAEREYDWIKDLPLYYETEHFVFVHAGITNASRAKDNSRSELLNMRDKFFEYDKGFERTVVFGHTPSMFYSSSSMPYITPAGNYGIDTGCVFGGALSAVVFEGTETVALYQAHRGASCVEEIKGGLK